MNLWKFLRGTTNNTFGIGDGVDGDKIIEANVPGANKPALRFNHTTGKWEVSHDGVNFTIVGKLDVLSGDPDTTGWDAAQEGTIWFTGGNFKGWNGTEIIILG